MSKIGKLRQRLAVIKNIKPDTHYDLRQLEKELLQKPDISTQSGEKVWKPIEGHGVEGVENLSATHQYSEGGPNYMEPGGGDPKMRGLNYLLDEKDWDEGRGGGLEDPDKRIPPSYVVGSEGDDYANLDIKPEDTGRIGTHGRQHIPWSDFAKREILKQQVKDKPLKMLGEERKRFPKAMRTKRELEEVMKRNITQENAVLWSKLKQRIAQVRLAYAGPPVDVINAFRNKEALKFRKKPKGRKDEYAFQTDGKTLYQSGYPIAEHTKRGVKFSYQKHPTQSTAAAGRMLGINTFNKKGKYYINGQEVNADSYDYVEVPFKDIEEGTAKVNPKAKIRPMTPKQRQKIKDQDYFSTKARREFKDPETGQVYDQVVIQPEDQEEINRVTGLDTPIPEETFAADIHHGIPVEKYPELIRNTAGATPLSKKSHREVHFPEMSVKNPISKLTRRKLKNARLKIARIRMAAAPGISMNPQHGRTIADAFDTMQHTPNSPKVKASYDALINETMDQATALQKKGIKFSPEYGKKGADYGGDIGALHDDIEKNKNLFYRKSDNDYKGFEDNPMFRLTDIRNSRGHRMRANDVFRSVHDINGHNLADRSDFTPLGEHKAYLQHRKMYSPLASKALFTETAGQANWSNYSKKHGAKNRYFQKMNKLGNIKFPQQKAGLLPDNIVGGSWHQRLGKQRNISRINIAQKSVMNLKEVRLSDVRRTWKEQAPNRKKSPKGFTILDGDVLDLNYGAHTQKILDKYPGKGNVYIVSNLKDVTDIDSPEVAIGFDKWKKLNYTPQAGGFEGGVEMNALFRAEDNEQAKAFTSDFDQDSYTEVRPDGTFGFYDSDGNEKHYD